MLHINDSCLELLLLFWSKERDVCNRIFSDEISGIFLHLEKMCCTYNWKVWLENVLKIFDVHLQLFCTFYFEAR